MKPKKKTWRRVVRWSTAIVLLIVLVPYLVSRVMSPWACVQIHANTGVSAGEQRAAPGELRIGCYNIAHGRGTATSNWAGTTEQRVARLREIGQLLRNANLDVVVLNEVDFQASWSGGVNQAEIIAIEAGFPYRVEQRNLDLAIGLLHWRFGNAVLSRFPITEAEVVDFPGYSAWETVLAGKKRGVVCTITTDSQQSLRVLGVHLSHRSEEIRVQSIKMVEQLRSNSDLPLICAGDYNSIPTGMPESSTDRSGENAITWLQAHDDFVISTNPKSGKTEPTFPSTEPKLPIDWIAIPSQWEFTKIDIPRTTLSDHLPVFATLKIPGPRTQKPRTQKP